MIDLLQRSFSVGILFNSIVAYGNKGYGNIVIYAVQHDVSTYNLTINNSISFGANGQGLKILSTQDNYRQCQATQNNLLEFTIVIVNSKFNHNNITGVDAVISINLIGVMFTARIIIHSTEISHNIGIGLAMYFFSYKYQSQFFVTLNNFIVDNNIWQYENGLQSAITALSATTLVLANVSITNNYNMTGLAVYHTAVMVNGTSSLFHNNTGIDGGGLAMYGNN